jgi:hypothetical protein
MSKKLGDRIEELAAGLQCVRHAPTFRACLYDHGKPCVCRQRATGWFWWIRIALVRLNAMNQRVRNSYT